MTLLKVDGLQIRYGNYEVLHDISFDLRGGEFVAVVGPNGSGKTTLVKALVGLIPPAAGTIAYQSVEFGDATAAGPGLPAREGPISRRKPRIGYLPQKASFSDPGFPANVREVVASGLLSAHSLPSRLSSSDGRRIDETLDLLMIADLADRRIGLLSGGQQQRAHLARALVSSPDILMLDEPTGALDPSTRACFYETMKTLNEERGTTIVFVTHDLEAASGYAGTLLFVDRNLVYSGPMDGFDADSAAHCYFGDGHQHGHKRGCGGIPEVRS